MRKSKFTKLAESFVTYRAFTITIIVFVTAFYFGLSNQIKDAKYELREDIKNIDKRIDEMLLRPAINAGLLKKASPSAVVTKKGEAFMLQEQELTLELHNIFNSYRDTTPEDAYILLLSSLGHSKIYEIIDNHKIDGDILFGMVLSFYGGVKYGKYLEKRKFILDE